jgi:endonuclease YncB( thermonuclease family)
MPHLHKLHSLILGALFVVPTAVAADLQGKVVSIADGDTLTILDASNTQHKIRLAGIDAPEKSQPFGARSKQSLSDCAYGKQVAIQGDKVDRYQRRIGKVMAGGQDCNLEQIKLGMAWHYKKYMAEQSAIDQYAYSYAETEAQHRNIGIWSDPSPEAPWDYRKVKRDKSRL